MNRIESLNSDMSISVRQQDEFSKFEYLIEVELEEFRRYITGLESSIERTREETRKWVDEEIWPDKTEIMPSMVIEAFNHVDIFTPNLFYKSTLSALYSFFESALREITKTARHLREHRIKIEDLKGNGITLYRDYLVKVIELDITPLGDVWNRINKVRLIRNSIVHNDFENLNLDKAKLLIGICNESDSLEFSGEIIIKNSKYLMDFAEDIQKYLNGLESSPKSCHDKK